MERATYLAQLYESVASIPPDIQQCLLTIAQYGCDPDQVKRWYNLVRSHFGVGEVQSPGALIHQASRPISRARDHGPKTEPPATPHVGTQDPAPVWNTPAPAPALASNVQYLGDVNSQHPIENLFDPSTPLPQSVVFTGHRLLPARGDLPPEGFNPELIAKSPEMPLLSPFDVKFNPPPAALSPRPKTVAPSNLRRSPPQKPKPAPKRRKLAKKPAASEEKRVMEPPKRPRRPSVPFRSNEWPFQLPEAVVGKRPASTPAHHYRPLPHVPVHQGSHSPFEDLYIPGQLHQPPPGFSIAPVQLSGPMKEERRASNGGLAEGPGDALPVYESPYAPLCASSC